MEPTRVYFTDFFDIDAQVLEEYGAFNISLINDLPLFIDPFLLFNSDKPEYQHLHDEIIRYLRFLRDKSRVSAVPRGLIQSWYTFHEVKQNWLGYSLVGNSGSGLGTKFANALHDNLNTVFASFGNEQVTKGSHLEKLCLIESGIGKDNISDFTTNLIKQYLLEYTQRFAREHIAPRLRRHIPIRKVQFNYVTETWEIDSYDLPYIDNDYIILTPKDILTKEEQWINRPDLLRNYDELVETLPNEELREQLNNYLVSNLSEDPTNKEKRDVISEVIKRHPAIIEYFIKFKEDEGDIAVAISDAHVEETEQLFISQVGELIQTLQSDSQFYELSADSPDDTIGRIFHLKDIIENRGGVRLLYLRDAPIRKESDLHILFRLTWCGAELSANNGEHNSEKTILRSAWDKNFVEFKLASNRQIKSNLEKLIDVESAIGRVGNSIRVIVYFTSQEREKITSLLEDLHLVHHPDVILINGDLNGVENGNYSLPSAPETLSGSLMNRFQRALLQAYPSETTLEQMVRLELDTNLSEITTSNGLESKTFDLMISMEARGQFDSLVKAAYSRNKGNVYLSEFIRLEYPQLLEDLEPESQ